MLRTRSIATPRSVSSAAELVVVSPHLDDAVLSLGGTIGREAAAGRRVTVLSCFTAGPPLESIPPAQRVFGDYSVRRAEDERALAALGAEHRWLDLPERIWRKPSLARTLHVFRTPPAMDDFAQLRAIRAAIGELIERGAELYVPLGVGHHVDHVEVALAALREVLVRGAFERVRFYEDPYALGRACRRAHFVARRRMWRPLAAPAWASPRVGALLQLVAVSARGPGIDDYLPEAATLEWSCAPAALAAADEDRKLAAVAEYRSQVKAFGGEPRVRAFMRRGHRALGGEPLWRCRPGRPR
ncbi:MAG TPA: PIG-L family deacetylase [Kofleriaceae bacterium]